MNDDPLNPITKDPPQNPPGKHHETKKTRRFNLWQAKSQIVSTVAASWISLIIGYSSAFTAPAESSLEKHFSLTKKETSRLVALLPAGALVGAILGGLLINKIGRKWTLFLTDCLFLASWTLTFCAKNFYYLYTARIIIGFSVGTGSLTLPVYVSETTQPNVRGILGLFPTAFGNIGILLCYLFGVIYEWHGLSIIAVILSMPFLLIFVWIIPETPTWYITKSKEDDCREALIWLRPKDADVDEEHADLLEHASSFQNHTSINDLFHSNVKPLLIVLGLMFFQQMTGINAVIFYTTKIFETAGSTLNNNLCTTIVGVVNFISTFIATLLIDRLGRKILLYISSVTMAVALFILGGYFYTKNEGHDVHQFGWVPLVVFIVYILGFSLGFGPIPWLMMGEILPSKIKATAASIATGFNWLCTYAVTRTFLLIIELMGEHGTFWMYGAFVVASLVFTVVMVPETKGKKLQDIEKLFVRKRNCSLERGIVR